MRLIDPSGTVISVSDERGEGLLRLKGYRLVDDQPGPPVPEPKAKSNGVRNNGGRRGPARKTS